MILPYFPDQSQPVLWVTCPWIILQNLLHPLKNQAMKYCSKDIFWFQITNSKREAWLYGQNSKKIRGNFVSLCSGWFTTHNICFSLLCMVHRRFRISSQRLVNVIFNTKFLLKKNSLVHLFFDLQEILHHSSGSLSCLIARKSLLITLPISPFVHLFFMKVSSL